MRGQGIRVVQIGSWFSVSPRTDLGDLSNFMYLLFHVPFPESELFGAEGAKKIGMCKCIVMMKSVFFITRKAHNSVLKLHLGTDNRSQAGSIAAHVPIKNGQAYELQLRGCEKIQWDGYI